MRGPCADATMHSVRYSPAARVWSSSAPSWSWRFDIRRAGFFRRGGRRLVNHDSLGIYAVAQADALSDVLQHVGEWNLVKIQRNLRGFHILKDLPDEIDWSLVLGMLLTLHVQEIEYIDHG